MSSIREKGKEIPAPNALRPNVVSALMLVGPLGLGILASALTDNPLGVITRSIGGSDRDAVAARGEAMGKSGKRAGKIKGA